MSELFLIETSESPRLKWLKKHGIATGENVFTPTHSDDYRYTYSRRADCAAGYGYGNSDEEAVLDLAVKQGWKLWNQE